MSLNATMRLVPAPLFLPCLSSTDIFPFLSRLAQNPISSIGPVKSLPRLLPPLLSFIYVSPLSLPLSVSSLPLHLAFIIYFVVCSSATSQPTRTPLIFLSIHVFIDKRSTGAAKRRPSERLRSRHSSRWRNRDDHLLLYICCAPEAVSITSFFQGSPFFILSLCVASRPHML